MSKHDAISQALRAEIAEGKYGRSGKLPSEAQLVERFGVSRPTIARALRDLQAEGLIERRAGSGAYINPQEPCSGGQSRLYSQRRGGNSKEHLDVQTNHRRLRMGDW